MPAAQRRLLGSLVRARGASCGGACSSRKSPPRRGLAQTYDPSRRGLARAPRPLAERSARPRRPRWRTTTSTRPRPTRPRARARGLARLREASPPLREGSPRGLAELRRGLARASQAPPGRRCWRARARGRRRFGSRERCGLPRPRRAGKDDLAELEPLRLRSAAGCGASRRASAQVATRAESGCCKGRRRKREARRRHVSDTQETRRQGSARSRRTHLSSWCARKSLINRSTHASRLARAKEKVTWKSGSVDGMCSS